MAKRNRVRPLITPMARKMAERQMERSRAARALISGVHNQDRAEDMALSAFMSIFHPEVPDQTVRQMLRERRHG